MSLCVVPILYCYVKSDSMNRSICLCIDCWSVVNLLLLIVLQPGAESGNVIVVLQQADHDIFSRKEHDLYVTHKLGVTEALCGMQFVVRQLDGRDLLLRNPPGNVIEPGMPMCSPLFYLCPLQQKAQLSQRDCAMHCVIKYFTKSLEMRQFRRVWVRDHAKSLKMEPFERLGVVAYSPSIVTMALSSYFWDIATYWLKSAVPLHSTPHWGSPSECRPKNETRIIFSIMYSLFQWNLACDILK